jgi:hypothetical protein
MPKNWGPEVWGRNVMPDRPAPSGPPCQETIKPLGDLLPARPDRIEPEEFFADVTE